uniref:Ras association domain-containing protein 8 n=1 Tax=Cacopsylla melanoneura TaxID=428564 RepID=A0A8D8VG52_9HEMI
MELKVWVEGLQKIVSGVTESTTCQDIVFALAHATGKTGRYTLIERFRNNERLLTPQDHPIKELLKLGEYANEVHFILQRSLQSATPPSSHPTGGSPSQNITQSQSIPSYANYKDYHNPTRKQSLFPNDLDSSSSQHSSLNSHVSMRSSSTSREEKSGSRPSSYHQDGKMAMSNNTTPTSTSQDLNGGTSTSQAHQYKELVRLINLQRDKLSSQQMELTRYDAEIMFWEGKTREQQHQMEYIAEESLKIEAVGRHTEQAIKNLGSVEEEHEIVRQQEKTLESEITLLRSKLANCETELLQCKNKIRLLMEEVQFEQRLLAKETEERHHMEKSLMREVERLQGEVDQARADTESAAQSGDKLAKEVAALEGLIVEKKKQLEKLIGDMKETTRETNWRHERCQLA